MDCYYILPISNQLEKCSYNPNLAMVSEISIEEISKWKHLHIAHLKAGAWCSLVHSYALDLCVIKLGIELCEHEFWLIERKVLTFLNNFTIENTLWRARSRSHVIDTGYEVIDDITLARVEMRLRWPWSRTYVRDICVHVNPNLDFLIYRFILFVLCIFVVGYFVNVCNLIIYVQYTM